MRYTETGNGTFQQPQRRFAHIHVDIMSPLPISVEPLLPVHGNRPFNVLARRNIHGRCFCLFASSCAAVLLSGWIIKFGLPDHITSDRGIVFTPQVWSSLGLLLGITSHNTTTYIPATNGMMERLRRTLKATLMSRGTEASWCTQLPWVLLGLRTSPEYGLDISPAEMIYSDPVVIPGDFCDDNP
ncbi:uncharacterized protein LOC143026014 [Oratosquilla oratoria]|uniref:uncharacterized protein LOC143026014 n=1 Tax=Oratosquilla oratoria TaxID=337810 RepID=UPI003F763685